MYLRNVAKLFEWAREEVALMDDSNCVLNSIIVSISAKDRECGSNKAGDEVLDIESIISVWLAWGGETLSEQPPLPLVGWPQRFQ